MRDEDAIDLDADDFRRVRRYLAPWVFAWPGDQEGTTYPPPSDLVGQEQWDGIMDLPTDVALKSSSYEGSLVSRLHYLQSEWIFSGPEPGEAPFMEEVALLASEEFDAVVFNALHGWYRQAIGCLRNALETLTIGAALAVTNDKASFLAWRQEAKQLAFGRCRAQLRDSPVGRQVDADAAPESVFGDGDKAWTKSLYARLCGYSHSQAGYNNADFWRSNGPVFVPSALEVVEVEFRETLAWGYLLLRLGWAKYKPGPANRPSSTDRKRVGRGSTWRSGSGCSPESRPATVPIGRVPTRPVFGPASCWTPRTITRVASALLPCSATAQWVCGRSGTERFPRAVGHA